MWTILFFHWCLVSLNLYVSCKKSYLSSHWELNSVIHLDSCIMSVLEGLSDCDDGSVGWDWGDSSLFGFVMIEWGWSDDNAFPDSPVYRLQDFERSCTSCDGVFELGPGGCSELSVKTELAVSASKNFVTKNRKLFVIVITMKSDCKFVLISVGFSTSNELTSNDDKVMSINGHVKLVTELDLAFDDNRIQNWSWGHIDQQTHSFGHINWVTFSG